MTERRTRETLAAKRPVKTHAALPRLRIGVSAAVLTAMIAGAAFAGRPIVDGLRVVDTAGAVAVLDAVAVLGNAVSLSQLVPSLLRLRSGLIAGAGVGLFVFPALLALTLLFGRGYCSSLCPLGTLQDAALFLRRRAKPIRLRFRRPRFLLRATSFAAVSGLWLFGSSILLVLLDPYAIVDRVLSTALSAGGPQAMPALESLPTAQEVDLVATSIEIRATGIASALFAVLLLLGVIAAAVMKGRIFCNTLCPAGSLLGVPARISVLRVRLDADRCTSCGACERVCPARCIDGARRRLFTGSCILCFSCLAACPHGALSYGPRWTRR